MLERGRGLSSGWPPPQRPFSGATLPATTLSGPRCTTPPGGGCTLAGPALSSSSHALRMWPAWVIQVLRPTSAATLPGTLPSALRLLPSSWVSWGLVLPGRFSLIIVAALKGWGGSPGPPGVTRPPGPPHLRRAWEGLAGGSQEARVQQVSILSPHSQTGVPPPSSSDPEVCPLPSPICLGTSAQGPHSHFTQPQNADRPPTPSWPHGDQSSAQPRSPQSPQPTPRQPWAVVQASALGCRPGADQSPVSFDVS